MAAKTEAIKRFLTAARSLANQGMTKESIMNFAKNEFGEITELFQKQINNIFKTPASGIEKIKIKDEVFDDTVVKLPYDDQLQPFNPRNPSKQYGDPKISIEEKMEQINKASARLDAMIKERLEKQNKDAVERIKKKKEDELSTFTDERPPKDPEFYTGGLVDVEPNLSDIGHGSDALMARTRLMSPGSQATTSTGLNYLLAEDNDNIRVPFGNGKNFEMYLREREQIERQQKLEQLMKEYQDDMNRKKVMQQKQEAAEGGRIGFSKGKLADAARRKFLKTAGNIGAGIAALKTGLLNFGKEAAPVVEKVAEKVSETAQGVPPYFLNLVNKIKNFGTKSSGIKERADNFTYKDYNMDIDYDTGAIEIKKTTEKMIPGGDEAGVAEEVYMTYKPGVVDETTKGRKPIDEYEEFTARPDMDGKMKDVETGVPDEVVDEAMEEIITKKASGGIARMIGE